MEPVEASMTSFQESIVGPFEGFYVARYALPVLEGYIGFAKICRSEPSDVWVCDAVHKIASSPAEHSDQAVDEATRIAQGAIHVIVEEERIGYVRSTVSVRENPAHADP